MRPGSFYRPLLPDAVARNEQQLMHSRAALLAAHEELSRLRAELRRAELASTRDPLTDLLNPRGLSCEWERFASAYDRGHFPSVTLLYIDLNGFKLVNDYVGHDVGDGLLSAFAGELRETSRPTDIVARVGGDEFVLVLPGVGASGAHALARRILARSAPLFMDHPVCARVAQVSGTGRVLDFSWGVAEVARPETLPALEHFVKTAEGRVEKLNDRRRTLAGVC